MKFICTQDNLAQGLSRVVPIAGRNKQLPILDHVLLQLREGVLHLTCTDLELGVHTIVPGKLEKDGSCAVSARKMLDYVQQLPNTNPINLELKGSQLHLKTKSFQAQFPVVGDEDFPLLPQLDSKKMIKLDGQVFCRGLTKTLFSAAKDDTRPEIHSVFIHGSKDKITLATTDSFRLVEQVIPLDVQIEDFVLLLPLTTAHEVVRLFSGSNNLELTLFENHLLFNNDTIELSSRLVDGKYPDYRQIVPTKFATTGVVPKDELARALKTLLVFLPRDSRRVQLAVKPSKEGLELSVTGENGTGSVEVGFEGSGGDLNILFNIQYLLEGLQYFSGDQVIMKCVGENEPVVLIPESKEKDAYLYIIMPIQAS